MFFKTFDSETTGLNIYKNDRLFCYSIGDDKEQGFFMREALFSHQEDFDNEEITWFMHNAKFDLAVLHKEGVEIKGKVICTQVLARLIENDLMQYGLDFLAKAFKLKNQKLDDVKDYCIKHGLWEWVQLPGKKTRSKNYFFTKVPIELLEKYNKADVATTHELGLFLLKAMLSLDEHRRGLVPPMGELLEIEMKITKILFEMEKEGIKVDVEHIHKGIELETKREQDAQAKFRTITGVDLVDSAKCLKPIFDLHGLKHGITDKGNASFKNVYLESQIENPIVEAILTYRDAHKTLGTYYHAFLYHKDENDFIHTNIKQSGTATGRFSCSDPNLQNLTKVEETEEDEDISDEAKGAVRRCFIPEPGKFFLSIDYQQMEYRLLLEYSSEMGIIEQVKAGLDVHIATASAMGATRTEAKTLNFMLLYGGGVDKLAAALKIPRKEAVQKKALYFDKLPKVEKFIEGVIGAARRTGVIYNKFGRRYIFNDRNFSYKAPNYLIQGGGSDTMRIAMIKCAEILKGTKSRMVMQIHDELLFSIDHSEKHLVPLLKEAMESAWPSKYLKLTVDAEWSEESWQNKKAWV